uniref:Uncharacterized protein n=1 Tax=Utricularia reniformis TaxID=192314 RepID=A0A1Y0B0D3_9LAMI|nr:hypothetical protein AEK19_MT0593 [Utricularia reniformis]ART30849.1 hypothetical protein AEK19_MT0593 [Utricularia reniformis]
MDIRLWTIRLMASLSYSTLSRVLLVKSNHLFGASIDRFSSSDILVYPSQSESLARSPTRPIAPFFSVILLAVQFPNQ